MLNDESNYRQQRFVIRPHRSLSWAQVKRVYIGMAVVSLAIAVGFAMQGFWPVLPFAGLELLALGGALYLCTLEGHRSDVVCVDTHTVTVEKGRRTPDDTWEFNRAWTQVKLFRSRVVWYPSRLVLRSAGKEVEVGDFLTEGERLRLAEQLREAIQANTGSPAHPLMQQS